MVNLFVWKVLIQPLENAHSTFSHMPIKVRRCHLIGTHRFRHLVRQKALTKCCSQTTKEINGLIMGIQTFTHMVHLIILVLCVSSSQSNKHGMKVTSPVQIIFLIKQGSFLNSFNLLLQNSSLLLQSASYKN
jgi:hypothetical protein